MWNAIGSKAQKVTQQISSTVAEIQKDIKEHRSRGGEGHGGVEFDEAEAYKQMLVSFQIDQAKLGKEMQAALREKEDEAVHWKRMYAKASGEADSGAGENGGGDAAGALGVDELVKLRAEADVLTSVNQEWEDKLKDAFRKSTEEAALRLKLEHEMAALSAKVKELDRARAASEDLIISLSAEKTSMLGSSGEANETIDSLVDEYSRLAAEHQAQRQMDAETIHRLENVRDELVEKLKAHERNILQLLQRGEEGTAMSQRDMAEGDVAAEPRSTEEGASSTAGGADMGELEKKLEEKAAELRAEKESALASLRQNMSMEMAKTVKQEKEAALSLAADGHAAALKRAVGESTAAAESRAALALEAALSEAKEQALEEKIAAVEAIVEKARKEAEAERKKSSEAHAELMKQSGADREELRERLEKEAETVLAAVRQELGETIEAARKAAEETNALYAKEYRARKTIHNRLMELQGNIRVLARVRPMLEVELSSGRDADVTSFPADDDIVISKPKERLSGSSGGRGSDETTDTRFEFDRVFKQDSSQQSVFEAVSPLVTSVLDGYNVCIFAYGQTGSGKTFTMEGPEVNPGVNMRALTDMFRIAHDRSEDVTYTFHMSMMEIYNETVFDLLRADGASKTSLDIRQRAGGGTSVPGLTEVPVESMQEVRAQLERGSKNRAVGAHDMNERSSRSHMIFNVRVEGTNLHTGVVVRSKLNLIDLAGSERISKTDATGDRLREAQNINRSLSALGDVISALSQNKGHVPFRNSKLTFVLQDALSGNSKVLMFVNVSPASYNVTETLCSLNFAARCRSIKLGAASKNQEPAEVARYRRTSETLHAQLVAAGMTPSASLGDSSASSSPSPSPSKGSSSRRKTLY